MRIGVPREIHPGEMRVATTPDVVTQLQKLGFTVSVESGAGAGASFDDEAYRKVGATVTSDARELWASSDIVLKVRPPETHPDLGVNEADLAHEGQVLIAFLWPAQRRAPRRSMR
jgi:NAD(P) transhydrogenase subunit alpha